MSPVERVALSLDGALLRKFSEWMDSRGYSNRSEAIRDLMRATLVEEEWKAGPREAMAVVAIVYDHESMELSQKLADVQHERHDLIVATLHVHMDAHNCLEVVVLRGPGYKVKNLGSSLMSIRGVKYGKLLPMSKGREF